MTSNETTNSQQTINAITMTKNDGQISICYKIRLLHQICNNSLTRRHMVLTNMHNSKQKRIQAYLQIHYTERLTFNKMK